MATVLTIDDDDDFNKYLELILSKNKFNFKITNNPKDFIAELNTSNPKLCLVDLNLDKLSGAGFQLIKAIRNKKGSNIVLIILSGRSASNDIAHAFEMGANDYLQKPISEPTLISKLNDYLKPNSQSLVQDFYLIPNKFSSAKIELNSKIIKLEENKITFASDHFFTKGTLFYLPLALTKKMFGEDRPFMMNVHNNWIEDDRHYFSCDIEFKDQNQRDEFKKFILSLS